MASRSLNRVQLIGNLTRDPELRYTPQGTAVCTFGLATNRSWTTEAGDKKEETEFHRLVAWNKLAEICSQFLFKGRRVYAEGRLQTRQWTAQDGTPRQTTEVVISEMIVLDSKRAPDEAGASPGEEMSAEEEAPMEEMPAEEISAEEEAPEGEADKAAPAADDQQAGDDQAGKKAKGGKGKKEDEVNEDDIPF